MSARPVIRWTNGGEAELLVFEKGLAELRSTAPFAPGSRPTGSLVGSPGYSFWLKVHRSRREDDGRYHVWGRVLNVTRELRDHLETALASSPLAGPSSPLAGPSSPTH